MASFSFALSLIFVLVIAAEIGRSEQSRDFTVTNRRYGYLHSNGKILYFSWSKQARSVFTLLRNNVIKDKRSGKCWHLKLTPTNQQVVLKPGCYGSRPLRWTIVNKKWLKAKKYGKCLSVWANPGGPILAGLNKCAAYNKMIINFLPKPPPPPKQFTVTNKRYGYLHSNGKILFFAWTKQAASVFILLRNRAIKDKRSGKCWHLKTPTNQQVVLKPGCYGSRPLRWTIAKKWLKVQKYGKCLSVWANPGGPILAGLNKCALYNQMTINHLPS